MRNLLIISSIVLSYSLSGQTSKFINEAKEIISIRDTSFDIELIEASNTKYDFLIEGTEPLESIFNSALKNISRKKPDDLKISMTLSSLAELATNSWKGSQYNDSKRWDKLGKYFRRATQKNTSNFTLMEAVSFRVPLVKQNGQRFYFDSKGPAGGANLYKGKKPKARMNPDDEDYVEPIPLEYFTEEEMVELFLKEIQRKRLTSDLRKGVYSYSGISVELDEGTLYRNKIPTARVVVILGARRLRRVTVHNVNSND